MIKEGYYWMHYFYLKGAKVEDLDFIAFQLYCLLQVLNISTLAMIASSIFGFDLKQFISVKYEIGFGLVLFLEIIYYFYLYKRRKIIIDKFERYSAKRRKIGAVCFRIYEVSTVIVYSIVLINSSK